MAEPKRLQDKARGMLVGLAVGDALGAPVEFAHSSSDIANLGDKIAHYQDHRLPKGVYTDDTEMALCLADSLLECRGYDSYDIMNRYWRWMTEGYRTYDGKPASDVGIQTRRAIGYFKRAPEYIEKTESAGNGAIMRLAPIILAAYPNERDHILHLAELSCQETHNSNIAINATRAFATSLYLSLNSNMECIEHSTCWLQNNDDRQQIQKAIRLAQDSKDGAELKDRGGYILDSLAIAYWGLQHFRSFEDGMLNIIKLGGDTDTNAAIYGQLAGAHYGYEAIPREWREGLYNKDEIVKIADALLNMPGCPIVQTRFGEPDSLNDLGIQSIKEILGNYKP